MAFVHTFCEDNFAHGFGIHELDVYNIYIYDKYPMEGNNWNEEW